MKYFSTLRTLVLPMAASLFLLACGGGASSPANPVLADAQGRWHGRVNLSGNSVNASTLVLPDGKAWMLFTTSGGARRLVHGNLTLNGLQLTGSAKVFDLDTGNVSGDVTWTASATAGASLTLNSSDALNVGNFTSTSFLTQTSPAINATGEWKDSLTTPTVQWTISSSGSLSGLGTGCTVAGQVLQRVDSAAVADVNFNEDCAGTVTSWTGVSLKEITTDSLNNTTTEKLKFTMIKSDNTKAYVLELVK